MKRIEDRTPKCGHPNRPYHAKGMCRHCYNLWYQRTHPEKTKAYTHRQHRKELLETLDSLPWMSDKVKTAMFKDGRGFDRLYREKVLNTLTA